MRILQDAPEPAVPETASGWHPKLLGKTTMFVFATLDPRPQGVDANDKIFEDANGVLGIEVTIPALASRCDLGNIDPQHTSSNPDQAAIELALTCELPADGATIITVRPDLDSLGSMAVLSLRAKGTGISSAMGRIGQIAESDKFARGGWPGTRPLPTTENPWPESGASASDSRPLAAIAAAVSDFKASLADRVSTMEQWLMTGEEPQSYRNQVERDRADMIAALESGKISVSTVADGKIALVVSTHRAATMVGYTQAAVVVALNPEFRVQGGEPHAKFTVCQFSLGFDNLQAAMAELQVLETGWGGSPTIIGSPQGVASTLTTEQVVEVVSRNLLK